MIGTTRLTLNPAILKDSDYQKTSEYERNYRFDMKLMDPRLGDITVLQDPRTSHKICVKERKINEKNEAGRQIINAKNATQDRHPYVLSLLDYGVVKHSDLCSTFYNLKLYYDVPTSDLKEEIGKRSKIGEKFTGEELTHVLHQQIAANQFLKSKGIAPSVLYPQKITYDKQRIESKLVNDKLGIVQENSRQEHNQRLIGGYNIYQSPSVFENLKKEKLNFQIDNEKENVFALGMIILEAGTAKSVQNVYNNQQKRFEGANLSAHISDFKFNFKDYKVLWAIVEAMLITDESRRPNFDQLKNSMPAYEDIKKTLQVKEEDGEHIHNIWDAKDSASNLDEVEATANDFKKVSSLQEFIDSKPVGHKHHSSVDRRLKEEKDNHLSSQLSRSKLLSSHKLKDPDSELKKELSQGVRLFGSDTKPQQKITQVRDITTRVVNNADEYGFSKPEIKQEPNRTMNQYPTTVYYTNMFNETPKQAVKNEPKLAPLAKFTSQNKQITRPEYNHQSEYSADLMKFAIPTLDTKVNNAPAPFEFSQNTVPQKENNVSNVPKYSVLSNVNLSVDQDFKNNIKSERGSAFVGLRKPKSFIQVNSIVVPQPHSQTNTSNNTQGTFKQQITPMQSTMLASVANDHFKPDGSIRHIFLKQDSIIEPKVVRSYSTQSLKSNRFTFTTGLENAMTSDAYNNQGSRVQAIHKRDSQAVITYNQFQPRSTMSNLADRNAKENVFDPSQSKRVTLVNRSVSLDQSKMVSYSNRNTLVQHQNVPKLVESKVNLNTRYTVNQCFNEYG